MPIAKQQGVFVASRLISSHSLVVLSALLLLCITSYANADGRSGLSPEAENVIKEFDPALYPSSDAVILLKKGFMDVGKDGGYRFRIHVVGKILKDKAKSDYNQIFVSFNSHYANATLDYAHTLNNGKLLTVAKDAVQIKTPPSDSKVYSDVRYLAFSLPGLEEGSVFEYEVTIDNTPIVASRWIADFSFNYFLFRLTPPFVPKADPVFKSTFTLRKPKGEQFHSKVKNIHLTPSRKEEGEYEVYTWTTEKLPGLVIEENMPFDGIRPEIVVSSIKDWTEVDRWAENVIASQAVITDEIRSTAQKIAHGMKTESETVRALFYFVQDKIKYVAADLNRGGYVPHSAAYVLKTLYGDCKDQAVLFIALMKAAGISAYPALINPYPYADADADIPSPLFAHVIVYIPLKDGDLWLDSTPEIIEFPRLLWSDQGRLAFVVDGQGGRLLKTPVSKADANIGKVEIDIGLSKGETTGRLSIQAGGALSDMFKSALKALNPDTQATLLYDFLQHLHKNAELTNVVFSKLDDPAKDFTVNAEFRGWPRSNSAEKTVTYQSNPWLVLSFFNLLYNLPRPAHRTHDYVLGLRFQVAQRETYYPPDGDYEAVSLPPDQKIENEFFSFSLKIERNGRGISSTWSVTLKENRIKKEDYRDFYNSVLSMMQTAQVQIAFAREDESQKKGRELEIRVDNAPHDMPSLLSLSRHYISSGNYAQAKKVLDRAVEFSPNNGEAHYLLGIALGYMDDFSKSKEEIKRARELGYRP